MEVAEAVQVGTRRAKPRVCHPERGEHALPQQRVERGARRRLQDRAQHVVVKGVLPVHAGQAPAGAGHRGHLAGELGQNCRRAGGARGMCARAAAGVGAGAVAVAVAVGGGGVGCEPLPGLVEDGLEVEPHATRVREEVPDGDRRTTAASTATVASTAGRCKGRDVAGDGVVEGGDAPLVQEDQRGDGDDGLGHGEDAVDGAGAAFARHAWQPLGHGREAKSVLGDELTAHPNHDGGAGQPTALDEARHGQAHSLRARRVHYRRP